MSDLNTIVCCLQSAVRAAIEGRVLVLEGVEKAERNVLPVLNNLLENREMQLEDGRLLIASHRYDRLLEVCIEGRCVPAIFISLHQRNFIKSTLRVLKIGTWRW